MTLYLMQALSGLAHASTLFLVASGLSIIFGVTRIVNFAHGSFYMLGAYLAYSIAQALTGAIGASGFWIAILLAAGIVGAIGVAVEMTVLRRIYRAPELFQLLATFGVVLVVQDAALRIWGRDDLFAGRAPGLKGTVGILGERFPQYHLFLIVAGPLVLGMLWWLFNRTRWGTLVRAATEDREMTGALGVNQRWLFTGVLFLGSMLAGLGGALQIPKEAVNLQMDINIIAEAFVVVVIGGMGSVAGAYLAALLVGEISALGILFFPKATLVLPFLVMAVVLMVRPHGLLGRAEEHTRQPGATAEPFLDVPSPRFARTAAAAFAVLAVAPLFLGKYELMLVAEMMIFGLFAASLHFIMSIGGLVSFGHAAYFGLGAYAAALAASRFGAPMEAAILLGPVAAGLGAVAFGWFCIRLSGVYLAMLTLAFAQILWSAAFQSAWTGGDNGILGVWPATWAASTNAYFYVVLGLAGAAVVLIWRIVFSPFGYALRAGRDSPLRSEAIGIDVRRQQWVAFSLAGALAGLAGALHAFHKGSVFPNVLSIPQSVDALVMVLMGGLQTLSGPVAGAAAYHWLQTEVMRATEYWRAILGAVILLLVIAFPRGIVGYLSGLREPRAARAST
jgi:branched-chain amino acid transport system permease protein